MDIRSSGKYPANKLSNFAGHRFTIDGIQCNSFEGFLQSLKFKSPEMQVEVCKLVGFAAKKKGADKNWQQCQTLYWQGNEINRHSDDYQILLDRAYNAMFEQSDSFRRALIASGDSTLTHKMGRNKPSETVLTTHEFISRLNKCRKKLTKKLF
jgi:predicted NAD-dependent protein-ADP-ribosyltransferase YbiA (DUF1768 family)